jgi:pimeloyl-ACP methyl ester carboxylesterase
MKRTTVLIVSLTFCICFANSQDPSYGSNSGKLISISNTKIYIEEYGSGTPLLMLHGGFGSIHDFQQVLPELAKHFRVIAMDSPGHGRSEQADSLSFNLLSDYCSELINKLNLDSLYIIGYSDGGITGLLLAAKRPDKVKKVIAAGANSSMSGIKPEVLAYLNMVNPDFIETHQKEWLKDYQAKSPDKEHWKKYISDMTTMYSVEEIISPESLTKIQADVLLVFGDQDVIKLEHGLEMHQAIPGSSICVLPNTPHEVFSAKPDLINTIGIDFLK